MTRVIHVWANPSRWPSGLSHAACSKNVLPDFAIPAGSSPADVGTALDAYDGRLCKKCAPSLTPQGETMTQPIPEPVELDLAGQVNAEIRDQLARAHSGHLASQITETTPNVDSRPEWAEIIGINGRTFHIRTADVVAMWETNNGNLQIQFRGDTNTITVYPLDPDSDGDTYETAVAKITGDL